MVGACGAFEATAVPAAKAVALAAATAGEAGPPVPVLLLLMATPIGGGTAWDT